MRPEELNHSDLPMREQRAFSAETTLQPSHVASTYRDILASFGDWTVYLDRKAENKSTLIEAVTRVKIGAKVQIKILLDAAPLTLSFYTRSTQLIQDLGEELAKFGVSPKMAREPALLGEVLAANLHALAVGECFLQKQADRQAGVRDPAEGTAIRVACGPNFPNNFHFEYFRPQALELWQRLASGDHFVDGINQFHFGILPILGPTKLSEDGISSRPSRYCGQSLTQVIDGLGLAKYRCAAWTNKGEGRNIPSRKTMMQHVVFDLVKIENGFSATFVDSIRALQQRLSLLDPEDPLRTKENLFLLEKEIALQVTTLEQFLFSQPLDREFQFMSVLLLKGMYIDAALADVGISHSHLHEGNITWELLDRAVDGKNLHSQAIVDRNFSFSRSDYLADPKRYHLITRMIDLGGLGQTRDK